MFYGYRFELSGKYLRPDELDTVEAVYAYVMDKISHTTRV